MDTFIQRLRARKGDKQKEQSLSDVCNLNNYAMDNEDEEPKTDEELNTPGQRDLKESDNEFRGYTI